MNSLNEEEKVLMQIPNSEKMAAKLQCQISINIYSPVDLQASWQIQPFWRNSLHTQYLQRDHTKVYLEFNNIYNALY